jgi:hypothetical protein
MSSSKNLTCKGTLRQMIISSEALKPPPPHTHTAHYTCIQYTYTHRERGGGGEN